MSEHVGGGSAFEKLQAMCDDLDRRSVNLERSIAAAASEAQAIQTEVNRVSGSTLLSQCGPVDVEDVAAMLGNITSRLQSLRAEVVPRAPNDAQRAAFGRAMARLDKVQAALDALPPHASEQRARRVKEVQLWLDGLATVAEHSAVGPVNEKFEGEWMNCAKHHRKKLQVRVHELVTRVQRIQQQQPQQPQRQHPSLADHGDVTQQPMMATRGVVRHAPRAHVTRTPRFGELQDGHAATPGAGHLPRPSPAVAAQPQPQPQPRSVLRGLRTHADPTPGPEAAGDAEADDLERSRHVTFERTGQGLDDRVPKPQPDEAAAQAVRHPAPPPVIVSTAAVAGDGAADGARTPSVTPSHVRAAASMVKQRQRAARGKPRPAAPSRNAPRLFSAKRAAESQPRQTFEGHLGHGGAPDSPSRHPTPAARGRARRRRSRDHPHPRSRSSMARPTTAPAADDAPVRPRTPPRSMPQHGYGFESRGRVGASAMPGAAASERAHRHRHEGAGVAAALGQLPRRLRTASSAGAMPVPASNFGPTAHQPPHSFGDAARFSAGMMPRRVRYERLSDLDGNALSASAPHHHSARPLTANSYAAPRFVPPPAFGEPVDDFNGVGGTPHAGSGIHATFFPRGSFGRSSLHDGELLPHLSPAHHLGSFDMEMSL